MTQSVTLCAPRIFSPPSQTSIWPCSVSCDTQYVAVSFLVNLAYLPSRPCLLLPFNPSSSASRPFQLFASLSGNPNSPTCESRRKARAKYRACCASLFFPPMPATLLPPSRDPQIYVQIFLLPSITGTTSPNLGQAWGLWLYTPCSFLTGLEGHTRSPSPTETLTTLCIYTNTFVCPSFISVNYKKRQWTSFSFNLAFLTQLHNKYPSHLNFPEKNYIIIAVK